ncbi:deoxynucleoside kinase [Thermoflavimicrobium daqui]|jgi:deoxyadenosine/deoxycytidine kinase|uniref:Deoxynucleoside kinase domain-containing protein n=1 Tax=Thermoflavimicrobium daqui TaxID=2137476 RepID=A0A364K6W7_9BACL|nr:deoxynucleoside kinase [Thermoflavimicrobium daqui]RAL25952.1 hypothetical protein DL897_07745 [Thermoflavimicrobium daqui]
MICFAGMFGIGKTTYAAVLGEHLDRKVYYEPVDQNPVLEMFYKNPKQYAFLLQIYFLSKRLKNIKSAQGHPYGILDRSIYEDALIVEVLYEL